MVRLRVISTRPSADHVVHGGLGMVARQCLLERAQHLALVLVVVHVDEVDDDDAAKIAQPQLTRRRLRGLEVGAVNAVSSRLRAPR